MPRIRSVHPGFFTDEDIAPLSDAAQVFLIGLWTEADDQGVFEWKPTTLKMKLRPASIQPVDPLLEELVAADRIRAFEAGGRRYGAIRNFRVWQRPKAPSAVHPLPATLRRYVGLTDGNSGKPPRSSGPISEIDGGSSNDISETPPLSAPPISETSRADGAPVRKSKAVKPDAIPRKGEIASQMEEGGKDVGGGGKDSSSSAAPSLDAARQIIEVFDRERIAAFGESMARAYPAALDRSFAERWVKAGADPALCEGVFEARFRGQKAKGKPPSDTLEHLDKAIANALAARDRPMPEADQAPNDNGRAAAPPRPNRVVIGTPEAERFKRDRLGLDLAAYEARQPKSGEP